MLELWRRNWENSEFARWRVKAGQPQRIFAPEHSLCVSTIRSARASHPLGSAQYAQAMSVCLQFVLALLFLLFMFLLVGIECGKYRVMNII